MQEKNVRGTSVVNRKSADKVPARLVGSGESEEAAENTGNIPRQRRFASAIPATTMTAATNSRGVIASPTMSQLCSTPKIGVAR